MNTVAKLYEGTFKQRLEDEMERVSPLSDQQFGFKKGRSTLQAVEKVL